MAPSQDSSDHQEYEPFLGSGIPTKKPHIWGHTQTPGCGASPGAMSLAANITLLGPSLVTGALSDVERKPKKTHGFLGGKNGGFLLLMVSVGGGNSNMFFSPRTLEGGSNLTNIFQMGWNQQLVYCWWYLLMVQFKRNGTCWWFRNPVETPILRLGELNYFP